MLDFQATTYTASEAGYTLTARKAEQEPGVPMRASAAEGDHGWLLVVKAPDGWAEQSWLPTAEAALDAGRLFYADDVAAAADPDEPFITRWTERLDRLHSAVYRARAAR